jgi:hypothetical protein
MLIKKWMFIILLVALGCTKPEPSKVIVNFSGINNAVTFKGLDAAIINQLARDSVNMTSWQALLPVYIMPADTDLKDFQPPQPGLYTVKDSLVIFEPDTPLTRGRAYFARCYDYNKDRGLLDMIKTRQKPGTSHFTEVIFKY